MVKTNVKSHTKRINGKIVQVKSYEKSIPQNLSSTDIWNDNRIEKSIVDRGTNTTLYVKDYAGEHRFYLQHNKSNKVIEIENGEHGTNYIKIKDQIDSDERKNKIYNFNDYRKEQSFTEVLNDPKSKQLIEDIEDIYSSLQSQPKDKVLLEMKDDLNVQLKDDFGYRSKYYNKLDLSNRNNKRVLKELEMNHGKDWRKNLSKSEQSEAYDETADYLKNNNVN